MTTPSHSSSATTLPARISLVRRGRRRGEAASSSTASPTRTRTTVSTATTSTTMLPTNTFSSWDYATANDVYDAAVARIRKSTTQSCDESTPPVAPQRYSIPTPAIGDGSIADNEDTSYQVKNVFRRSSDRNSPPQPETAPAETTDYTTSPTSGSTTTGPDMAAATHPGQASPSPKARPKLPADTDTGDGCKRTYSFTIGEKDWKKSFKKGCIKCIPIRKKEKGRVRPDCEFCNRPLDLIRHCTRCYTASYCNSTCQSNDWKSHKDYCKHASKPENKAALARYNQRAQSFDTLGMDLADKAGAILLNWDQLQQLPPGILNLTRTASLLKDDDDAEANINVDGDVNNETTDDKHQEYYYHDIVKQGDYYPQERGKPALATFVSRSTTTRETYTGTRGSEKRNKADTVHIVLDTDDEDNSTSSGDHALSTVAQRRPPAPDLLDSGANRYVFGNTTATITGRKEARVTSLKNISGQREKLHNKPLCNHYRSPAPDERTHPLSTTL
eukprot:g19185.t1